MEETLFSSGGFLIFAPYGILGLVGIFFYDYDAENFGFSATTFSVVLKPGCQSKIGGNKNAG
jgi:hypothetical protein